MYKNRPQILANEGGFVLIAAIMVLLILVIIGMSATTTSIIESKIAGADKAYKKTFYAADGGTEVGSELLEQNISCPGGFTSAVSNVLPDKTAGSNGIPIYVADMTLYQLAPPTLSPSALALGPNNGDNFETCFPAPCDAGAALSSDALKHYLSIGGVTQPSKGGALQQLAGYEGKGKGAAGGGGTKLYDIYSRYYGALTKDNTYNSETLIFVEWRHVIGQEGACNY